MNPAGGYIFESFRAQRIESSTILTRVLITPHTVHKKGITLSAEKEATPTNEASDTQPDAAVADQLADNTQAEVETGDVSAEGKEQADAAATETDSVEAADETEGAIEVAVSGDAQPIDAEEGEGASEPVEVAVKSGDAEAGDVESGGSDDNVSDENEAAPEPDAPKLGLVGKVLNNYKVISACIVSLVVGFAASGLMSGEEPEVEEEVAVGVEKPRFVAAISRRGEAIRPLVPFDDLDEHVVELGKKLFHDPALSGNGRVSCSSCHVISSGGADGKPLAEGVDHQFGDKNTLSVLNSAYNFVQFWDGRVETLEEQIDGPLLNPIEMDSDWGRILKYLKTNKLYLNAFEDHLGGEPNEDRVRQAIATYERSLVTPNSTFDQWLAGDEKALNGDEYAGYFLFKKMNCMGCHNGPGVGGNSFEKLGKFKAYFNKHNPGRESDLGRFLITGEEHDKYVFRVPQLRNVELTGPYFHDGSVESLDEAVRLMIEHQVGLEASDQSVKQIVSFLKTLTGEIPR